MARSCGIRIGAGAFELVVLDGGPRKHRVVTVVSGELPPLDDPAAAGAALARALKGVNVPRENVGLALDSRHAAFRKVKLPFSDRAKIEQVLKYEVEGELPQFSIEDVVVDFLVLSEAPDGIQVLTTAVPKSEVRRVLDVCVAAGVEPLEVELETTAMVNAAHAAGTCQVDNAVVLVHVGEESTSVVTVDGGAVREMRVIHMGAGARAPRPAEEGESGENGGDAQAEGTGEPEEGLPGVPSSAELERRLEQVAQRVRRELMRTISGARTTNELASVHLCGHELPGLVGGQLMDLSIERLRVPGDPVADAGESSDGEQGDGEQGAGERDPRVARDSGHVVAYGVALRQLGGGILTPSLRREELRYTGAFERIELPLAVAALLLVTLVGVWNIFLSKEINLVRESLAYWWTSSNNFMLTNLQQGVKGNLEFPPEDVERYVRAVEAATVQGIGTYGNELSRYDSLNRVRARIHASIRDMQKQLGRDTELKHPQSAFKGAALVLDVFDELQDELGRFSFRMLDARTAKGTARTPEHVVVRMDITFFADSAREATDNYERLMAAFNAKPWGIEFVPRQNVPLENGKGIHLAGIEFKVDVSRAEGEEAWS